MSRLTDEEKGQLRNLLDKVREKRKRVDSARNSSLADVASAGPLYPSSPYAVTGWTAIKQKKQR